MTRILIVRLGSLGDLVHALPAVAALREAFPAAGIDWIVDPPHAPFLALVPILNERIEWRPPSAVGIIRALRRRSYDAVFDFQGLIKSAAIARLSGARRTIGFDAAHLREPAARVFYSERRMVGSVAHVIQKNAALVAPEVGGVREPWTFPIDERAASIAPAVLEAAARRPFALLNPGASWETKRWPVARFGAVADHLLDVHGLRSLVLWGPGEESLARAIVEASARRAAAPAPPTTIAEAVALCRAAALMVSADTGPMQIAAAIGTPVVGLFGPTSPARNGPWGVRDLTVSRFDACQCHHQRRCRVATWCLGTVDVAEVCTAVDRVLAIGH